MAKINFLKIRDVKNPQRAHVFDAGIDFFVPKFTEEFIMEFKEKNANISLQLFNDNEQSYILLQPHERVNIPSGICSRMNGSSQESSHTYALIAYNKSGISTKLGLDIGACVIDYTYEGEIHLSLINTSNLPVKIYEDMKIAQFIEMQVNVSDVIVDDVKNFGKEEFYKGRMKDRNSGGFGSTDKPIEQLNS